MGSDGLAYIYQIKNINNSKIYIGSTDNYKKRISTHKYELRKNIHCNKHLQYAWNKYGENNFEFSILCEVSREDKLDYEQKYIDSYDRDVLYNASISTRDCARKNPDVIKCKTCGKWFGTYYHTQKYCAECRKLEDMGYDLSYDNIIGDDRFLEDEEFTNEHIDVIYAINNSGFDECIHPELSGSYYCIREYCDCNVDFEDCEVLEMNELYELNIRGD